MCIRDRDVLSVPSRFSEAFGLFVVEALAAGTPVVQPDVCGFREMIEATGGGRLCFTNTPSALAATLAEVLANPAELRRLGECGRQAVSELFSDAAMAREVLAETRSLLGHSRTPASPPRP